jgi:phosphate transport system protein
VNGSNLERGAIQPGLAVLVRTGVAGRPGVVWAGRWPGVGFGFDISKEAGFFVSNGANPNSLAALENEIKILKEKLLTMASHAESAVNQAIKALLRRDDELARRTREADSVIDRLEMEIDELGIGLLARELPKPEVRLITTAMKIAHDLERVGDEATTIARRTIELSRDPQLKQTEVVPEMGQMAMGMLKEALDAFVNRDPDRARAVIPRDKEVDGLNKQIHLELPGVMAAQPETISRCLNLMVISKSLERIADHATNVAEMVVYMCEGRDIRHSGKSGRWLGAGPETNSPSNSKMN